ncbi:hypothetical protein EHQ53_15615 [Leptospira langatensis]|uniref:Uncharacterized protein n=1 Tax=Leptospira langatensis TaxID=2484983 RepID=A0A5F1ZSL6_9LEPT|nr:hypothetical protein [Leptospira langatensis]TGK01892.1 hypothetical protein EHO57_08855 [Leptospira langatensis]TGL39497.1 hypothetical protein EHQ53_15615 [Leptospira langatensis]
MNEQSIYQPAFRNLALAIGILALSFCSQTETDPKGEGFILQSLINTSAQPVSACKSSAEEAENCLSSTSDLSGSGEGSLAKIFSGGSASSYESYCNQLLEQGQMSKLGAKVQECIFNCNAAYWSRVQSEGSCEGDGTELITGSGVETLNCLRNCKELYLSEPEPSSGN